MSTDHVSTFESSLTELAASVRRVPTADLADALDDVTEPPVVGAPLPFEGVSLADLGIEPLETAGQLEAATTGVTAAGLGVAEYGTVTLRTTPDADELVSLYPERHVVVLAASDVVPDLETAFERLGPEFREEGLDTQILNTGPSSTGDMGKLYQGVHGPKQVHYVVLEDR
ncbi:MAG: LUD domain-containing protein [Haloarculaceae archaeon]